MLGQIMKSIASVCLCALLRLQFLVDFDEILHGGLEPEK